MSTRLRPKLVEHFRKWAEGYKAIQMRGDPRVDTERVLDFLSSQVRAPVKVAKNPKTLYAVVLNSGGKPAIRLPKRRGVYSLLWGLFHEERHYKMFNKHPHVTNGAREFLAEMHALGRVVRKFRRHAFPILYERVHNRNFVSEEHDAGVLKGFKLLLSKKPFWRTLNAVLHAPAEVRVVRGALRFYREGKDVTEEVINTLRADKDALRILTEYEY